MSCLSEAEQDDDDDDDDAATQPVSFASIKTDGIRQVDVATVPMESHSSLVARLSVTVQPVGPPTSSTASIRSTTIPFNFFRIN